jgi:hypothetical protein
MSSADQLNRQSTARTNGEVLRTRTMPTQWRIRFVDGEHAGVEVDIPSQGVSLGGAINDGIAILDTNKTLLRFKPCDERLKVKVCETTAVFGHLQRNAGDVVAISKPVQARVHGITLDISCTNARAPNGLGANVKQTKAYGTRTRSYFARAGLALFSVATLVYAVSNYTCLGSQCEGSTRIAPYFSYEPGSKQAPVDVLRDLLAGYRVPSRVEVVAGGMRVMHAMDDVARFSRIRGDIELAMVNHTIDWQLANEDTLEPIESGARRSLARQAVARFENSGFEAEARRFFSGSGRVVQVNTEEPASISTARGGKLYAGADLGRGLVLARVTEQHLVIKGPQEREIVLDHDGQRTPRLEVTQGRVTYSKSQRHIEAGSGSSNDVATARVESRTSNLSSIIADASFRVTK